MRSLLLEEKHKTLLVWVWKPVLAKKPTDILNMKFPVMLEGEFLLVDNLIKKEMPSILFWRNHFFYQ